MDINKVKEELEKFSSNSGEQSQQDDGKVFKPQTGEQVIRIVPYVHNPEMPFIKLYWHYNLMGKHYVSPMSFGEADPLVEFANKLLEKGTTEDFKLAKKIQPKLRIYAPVLIRGQEHEGPKFWGFSKTLYADILGYIYDPDYGDITDPKTGRDITLQKVPAEETEYTYPTYKLRIKPNQTPMTDSQEVVEKIKKMDNIRDVFYVPDYNKLNQKLEEWIKNKEETVNSEEDDGKEQKSQPSDKQKPIENSSGNSSKEVNMDGVFSSETSSDKEESETKKEESDDSIKTDGKSALDRFNELF